MFAGVPSIVREGFNYGFKYPYVNDETGCYADENSLPAAILRMLERSPSMSPRQWVMDNMTCQLATTLIGRALKADAQKAGEPWTTDLAVKVSRLTSMRYWDEADASRFQGDYDFSSGPPAKLSLFPAPPHNGHRTRIGCS
jgi:hypothetical protein